MLTTPTTVWCRMLIKNLDYSLKQTTCIKSHIFHHRILSIAGNCPVRHNELVLSGDVFSFSWE
jgi:hypothetical protein